jgi:hypothetical protein
VIRLAIIWFNVEEVMNYLDEFGEVFTLRDHFKSEGTTLLMSSLVGRPYYKGKVKLKFVCVIDRESETSMLSLDKYASKSGFNTREAWMKKVEDLESLGLNTKERWLYLYHAKRILEIVEQS